MSQFVRAVPLYVLISFLTACGGGTASSPPPPAPPAPLPAFAVVSSKPADMATGAPRTGGFAATFSVAPDPGSINATTVQLLGPLGNAVPGALVVNGNDVSLMPDADLPGGTKFTVNFAPAIKDMGARTLNAPYSRSFTTAPQNWGTVSSKIAELQFFTSGITPSVAIDKSGNVTAVWRYQVNRIPTAFASRMDHSTGIWTAPVVIHAADDMSGDIGGLGISADGNGNVYVFYADYSGSQQTTRMARYVAATSTWDKPVPLSVTGLPQGMSPSFVVSAVDGKGNLTVVMRSNFQDGLYSARFDPAAGTWSAPIEIQKPAVDNYIFNVNMVADSAGNLTVGWVQYGSLNNGFNVARFSPNTGKWSEPHTLDVNITSQPFALAPDVSGGATVAWTHGAMMMDTPSISASRFDPGSGQWTAPVQLSGDGDVFGAGSPAVATDAAGIATVVWAQSRGIFGARSGRSTSTWTAAERIGTAAPGNEPFSITADRAGNVLLAYVEDGATMAMQYSATDAHWKAPAAIGKPDAGENVFANAPVSVIDVAGNVTAVWLAQISVAGTAHYVVAANRYH